MKLHITWRYLSWCTYICGGSKEALLAFHIKISLISWGFRALLHSATHLQRHLALNGLQNHFQVTDKFDTSIDADAWCDSTRQNPYILIWERSGSGVANAGCKRTLTEKYNIFGWRTFLRQRPCILAQFN